MERYLLDTNVCIAAMRNHPTTVRRMAATLLGECALSTITGYELYTGVEKCSLPVKERAKVDLLLRTVTVLAFDAGAAKEAARIRALLESQGQPIGPYDILLAGQALVSSLILVTANSREFTRVPGLTLEDWQT
ncbi:MAG: PIN domain-containing protein [Gemmataceae bacterium]